MIFFHQEWIDAVCHAAQDGAVVSIPTDVSLTIQQDLVTIVFCCKDNPYLGFNKYQNDNDPLYEQEVFEVFISGGSEPSESYLELEANPNGALWAGVIQNPGLGLEGRPLQTQFLTRQDHCITLETWQKENQWGGTLVFPLTLIPGHPANEFRFNFYRIVAKMPPQDKNWSCHVDNAHFLCLFPTLSGEQPAFHRPYMFGQLINPIEASM
ncbi:MAG: carbohydrate-binding family 9-like protein [Spirosomataceae bacterium]